MRGTATRAICAALLAAAPAADAQRALITAQDHRGNRIEPFRQTRYHGTPGERRMRNRNCTSDRLWCAELRRDRPRGGWSLHILVRTTNPSAPPRQHSYPLPPELCCTGPGARNFTVWDEIVREPRGRVLVGIVFGRETRGERGFRSYQRRLHLLLVPREDGGVPVPVLDAPLSGVVNRPGCGSAEDQRTRPNCLEQFYLSTLVTLVPSVGPVSPPHLIMVTTARLPPGRRASADGPMARAPIRRAAHDEPLDPACTYTRSYYFDAGSGRYVPDAPLPDCREYLEP